MDACVIYCRVSTEEQSDSLPVQQKKCEDFAASQRLRVMYVFTDAESARTADRPQLQAMLTFCRGNPKTVKHVVVSDLSRLARNVVDQGNMIARLAEWQIRLRSVDEQSLDDSATGKLGKNIIGAFSQFFSDSLSERTKFRMAEAVKAGRFVWVAPVGYLNTKNGTGSVIKPDSKRAALVRKGFELMATGNYSADDVLRTVTALGLTTRKGAPVPRQTWHAMLRNPVYAGWVKSGDLLTQGLHQPIVPQQLFEKVQSVLAGNSRAKQPRQVVRADFPLKQFIRCAKCNRGLTAGVIKKRFPYLWCYTKGCRDVLVSKDELEQHFVQLLALYQPTIEYLNRLPEIAAKQWRAREERVRQDTRALKIRLDEQKRLNSQAVKAKLTGELSSDDFDLLKQNITDEIQKIEAALSSLEQERKMLQEMSQQARLEKISFLATWRAAGIEGKLKLQQAMFPDGLVWSHETGFLNPKNQGLMQDLRECFQKLTEPDSWDDEVADKFGVPDGI
ncbi:MAG TPA: recombinase family protein [Terriglobales bacterium]|nr:recombinase family protein [Terriglobales bacterium]